MNKESAVYIFVGEDALSKDMKLQKLKEEYLAKGAEYFNFDTLFGKELNLVSLQERLLCLPLKVKKRLILIKDSQDLKEDIKDFLLKYVKKPYPGAVLILDINKFLPGDRFIRQITSYGMTFRFKETPHLDAFTLSRSIDLKKPSYALWVLNQLLRAGEKPERILGGLRYSWENRIGNPQETKRKLKLLLNCDIDIKTGRLKPDFALERTVINLCYLAKPSG